LSANYLFKHYRQKGDEEMKYLSTLLVVIIKQIPKLWIPIYQSVESSGLLKSRMPIMQIFWLA